jgi:hypothetical protein
VHRTSRRGESHHRPEPHRGPGGTIVVACVAGAVAVLVVLALPVFLPRTNARATNAGAAPAAGASHPWDATSDGAEAGMQSISRGTQAANAARLSPDPVATVRDASLKYKSSRLIEIKDELAKIDATDWKTQADLDRRQALLDEQGRLLSR